MKKAIKKADKQSGPMKTMVWRSCMSALMVLDEIQDIPFEKLSPSLYFISLDLKADELTKRYDAMLELAGIYPDKFVDRLHKDLNEMSVFIRENNLLPELFEMITLCDRLRYTYLRENPQAIHVINAYLNLAMQTLEYMRPDKFNFNVTVCGCTTQGEVMVMPEYLPAIDEINSEMERLIVGGKQYASMEEAEAELHRIAVKRGYPMIYTVQDLEFWLNSDRLFTNQRSSLCTYINEYTYDMLPQADSAFLGDFEFLFYIHLPGIDVAHIEQMLKKRARTLPFNGMLFEFNYDDADNADIPESYRISKLFLKETFHDGHIVLLYKLTMNHQDICGYFDTANQFFLSILLSVNDYKEVEALYTTLRTLILYLYAAATSKDMEKMLKKFTDLVYLAKDDATLDTVQITVQAYSQGGKPRNHYSKEDSNVGVRSNDERYEAVPRAIQGYIRKLPVGQSASQEAVERALALGFDLAENETYVQPFIKSVLRLRENTEQGQN